MVSASSRKATGRALAVAGLLVAGLFCLSQFAPAPAQTKDKAPAKDKAKDKDGVAKGPSTQPARLPALKMVIASKDSDVAEMKKVIDEKLAKAWEENKVSPSGYCDDYEFLRRASLDIVGRIAKPEE